MENNKQKSLFSNFIFNFIKTLSSLIFPLVTFTYSTHVLGVDGVGKVNFVKSATTYFSMLALLGLNYYGTREAAKIRDNPQKLNKFCCEMLLINGCATIVSYIAFFVSLNNISKFGDYRELFLINSVSIILTGLGMEWLYQALEEYKYITLRTVLMQIVSFVIMVITVNGPEDVNAYMFVLMLATSGTYFFNLLHAMKLIHIKKVDKLEIKKHLAPILWLFMFAVSIELYTVLDTTMLGFIKGDTAVGLYTAAIKINKIVIALITSVSVVLIPRLSYYLGIGDKEKTGDIINKAYQYSFLFSIPAFVGLFVLSDNVIFLFGGEGFETAAKTMRILMPIVLVIPFSVMTNQQTLIPMGKEKLVLFASGAAAVTNLTLNSFLIPVYAENGAAIATVAAETIAALVSYVNAKKHIGIGRIFKGYYQYWLAALPIILINNIVSMLNFSMIMETMFVVVLSVVFYCLILSVMKNDIFMMMIDVVGGKISRRKNKSVGGKDE